MSENRKRAYTEGLKDGVPIGLGYLFVSFGFGILAVDSDLSVLMAVLCSMTNLTSAGQAAAVGIIAATGTYIEMAAAQLVINLRYSLMSISVSQKLSEDVRLGSRLLISFGITDEVFAVASSKSREVGKFYMYGLITLPYVMWAAGTLLGACAGTLLPEMLKNAFGILLYGMFIAIVVPPATKHRGVLATALIACALSCGIYYLFPFIPTGFSIIICAVTSSVICALCFPTVKERGAAV